MVAFKDTKLYAVWIKFRDALSKKRSNKAEETQAEREAQSPSTSRRSLHIKRQQSLGPPSLLQLSCKALCRNHQQLTEDDLDTLPCDVIQGILDELIAEDELTRPGLELFRQQSLDSFVVEDLPQLQDDWLALLKSAPLRRVHLPRCMQISDAALCTLAHQISLHELNFEDCSKLTDQGLACLQGLSALTMLNLHGCHLVTANGVANISGLTNLKELNLEQCNAVSGLHSLTGLLQLEKLDLGWCTSIRDQDMQAVAKLTRLTALQLSGTRVSDDGMACMVSLSSLARLGLRGTRVTAAGMASVAGLQQLESLSLAHTAVGSQGLVHLVGLQKLTQLDLAYVSLTDAGITSLQQLPSLIDLNLDNCNLTDRGGYRLISALANLRKLNLQDTLVKDEAMEAVAQLTSLQFLNLEQSDSVILLNVVSTEGMLHSSSRLLVTHRHNTANRCVGDAGLKQLSALISLTYLNLDSRQFTDKGLKHIKGLTNLVVLDLFAAKVSDLGCGYLRHLQKLESLEICGGRVTDAGAAVLSTIPSLTSLSLTHNVGITDSALPSLARLTNLCSLSMTHCKITGPGLTALYGLTDLVSFSACNTRIRRSAADKLQAAMPNIQKLRLGHSIVPPQHAM